MTFTNCAEAASRRCHAGQCDLEGSPWKEEVTPAKNPTYLGCWPDAYDKREPEHSSSAQSQHQIRSQDRKTSQLNGSTNSRARSRTLLRRRRCIYGVCQKTLFERNMNLAPGCVRSGRSQGGESARRCEWLSLILGPASRRASVRAIRRYRALNSQKAIPQFLKAIFISLANNG